MKSFPILGLLLLITTSCSLPALPPLPTLLKKKTAPEHPQQAVGEFYGDLRHLKVDGLPDAKTWRQLKPRVSPELGTAIESAQKQQKAALKVEPDEKPPFADGDLFSSLFEGPQKYTVGQARIKEDRAEVPVLFSHSDRGDTIRWTDTVVAIKTSHGWLVDDVIYGGRWDFAPKGTLSEALKR